MRRRRTKTAKRAIRAIIKTAPPATPAIIGRELLDESEVEAETLHKRSEDVVGARSSGVPGGHIVTERHTVSEVGVAGESANRPRPYGQVVMEAQTRLLVGVFGTD